jgi:hypothetical protein
MKYVHKNRYLITKEEIIKKFTDYYSKYNESPSMEMWKTNFENTPKVGSICRYFGGWQNALKAANLPPSRIVTGVTNIKKEQAEKNKCKINEMKMLVKQLALEGKDAHYIMKVTQRSWSTVRRWLKEINIKCNNYFDKSKCFDTAIKRAEENRKIYQQQGRDQAKKKDPLHMMCCMLYWAEGSKSRNVMNFVNSDVQMLKLFRKFISIYFSDKKLKVSINYYETPNLSYDKILEYWCEQLDLKLENFRKPQIRNKYYDVPKFIKYKYGIVGLNITSVEVIQHIYGAIQEYIGVDINKLSPIYSITNNVDV